MKDEERKVIQFKREKANPVSQSLSSTLAIVFCNECLRHWTCPDTEFLPVCMICKTNAYVEKLKTWIPKWPRR